jgi:hypothetical protein
MHVALLMQLGLTHQGHAETEPDAAPATLGAAHVTPAGAGEAHG